MQQKLGVYFLIIVIFILLFLFYFNKDYIKNFYNKKESFYQFDKNVKPNFVTNYENIDFSKYPDYKYENITEYNFNRIFKKINIINKNKIKLDNNCNYNFYTQSTTEDKLRMNLDIISKYVILVLNNDGYYDFNKTNFGDVQMWVDNKGNEEFKYELFLWDKKNFFEIKLWVNIIKFVEENQAEKYGVRNSPYLFPDFNIGLPFKDQIIPLPTEVIITGHFDTGISTIRPNEPSKIKYLYINYIEVQNSTLIVDYHKNKYPYNKLTVDENNFSGITDSSLEYVNIKNRSVSDPYVEEGRKYNKWPTLDGEPKWKAQYPAKFPPVKKWNTDGVYYYDKQNNMHNESNEQKEEDIVFTQEDTEKEKDRYCDVYEPGTRWSEQKEELQPYFWISNYVLPKCGENEWLFDNVNGGNIGGNVFVGGGKK